MHYKKRYHPFPPLLAQGEPKERIANREQAGGKHTEQKPQRRLPSHVADVAGKSDGAEEQEHSQQERRQRRHRHVSPVTRCCPHQFSVRSASYHASTTGRRQPALPTLPTRNRE